MAGNIIHHDEEGEELAMAAKLAIPMLGQQAVIGEQLMAFETSGLNHVLVFRNGMRLSFTGTIRIDQYQQLDE
jgi:hypothetical protein